MSSSGELKRFSRSSFLRVTIPDVVAHTILAPALPRFMVQNRGMRLLLQVTAPGQDAPDSASDVTVCICRTNVPPSDTAVHLATLREIACVSPEFLACYGEPMTPGDLDPTHCVGVLGDDESPESWLFRRADGQVVIEPAAPFACNDAQCAVAAALHGAGYVRLLELAVESQISAGLLTPVLRDWHGRDQNVWLTYDGALTEPRALFNLFARGLFPATAAQANASGTCDPYEDSTIAKSQRT